MSIDTDVGLPFSKLTGKARERAIEWAQGELHDSFQPELLTQDMQTLLADDYGFSNADVYWSLNYCQGDGVAFEATTSLSELMKKDEKLKRLYEAEQTLALLGGYEPIDPDSITVKVDQPSHRYYGTDVTVYCDWCEEGDSLSCLLHKIDEHMKERVKAIAKALEKFGYKYIENEHSEEAAISYLEICEDHFLFDEEGEPCD